ncbi:MAG: phytanoyl-CoA dioxygenase family protein [Bdellovibrionales bacterium]|nr:phytanoyl-CoA dioxygenase family protein [Bdellovibrionales bacterium]
MILSKRQIHDFLVQGYLHLPGFFTEHQRAWSFLKENGYMDCAETWLDVSQGIDPKFLEFEKPIAPLAQQILKSDAVLTTVQVSNIRSQSPAWNKFHIDGENHVMVRQESFDGMPWFKVIVGIFLTPTRKNTGELFICPGGHWQVQNFFKKNAHRFWHQGQFVANSREVYQEMVQSLSIEFVPLYADPGDVVMFHCLVPHTVGANQDQDRPVTYYRYGMYEHKGEKALTNMWQGFEGLEQALPLLDENELLHSRVDRQGVLV